ncbi:MAG: LysR family transcriptional regulator, partial [Atopobiaceae bacterium]|nr:LysR family transcriptional regulator [Atopobiaceae bacterium]
MELEQMRQLDAIARCGTISAAAEELHLSQPALSRSIRRLERELGQELFDRTHNSATLNDAGRLAVDHARNLLRDERMMLDAFADLARRQRTLLVGTVAPAPVWHLTALTVERFPGTLLNPVTLPEDEVERRLMNRSVDLAITLRPQILPTMRSTQIMVEDLYAFLPQNHHLAS